MATLASSAPKSADRERGFFFGMAVAMAATAVIGFGSNIITGRSSFGAPWFVHVHGVTMMTWLALYVFQNWQIWRGDLRGHRTLGWVATVYIGWMVIVGLSVTTLSVAVHRTPPFFDPGQFLALDYLNIAGFAILSWSAIILRRKTDWHRRLMLCGTISTMGPAWGRLLPLPLMGPWKLPVLTLALLIYVAVAVGYDLKHRGRIHPAYYWGTLALVLMSGLVDPLGYSPLFIGLANALMA